MIRRITFENMQAWLGSALLRLADLYERHINHNHIIDQQSQVIVGLMNENGQLSSQLERTQSELTKVQESYQFYFDAYIREMQRDQNTKRR